MKSRLETALDLLHTASEAALATFSAKLAGYPYASQIPFVLDERHNPVLLVSGLAEHSRNLTANPRASLLVSRTLDDGEIARVTLTGVVEAFDPAQAFVVRYLRYHPAAQRFLPLGDFGFRRFAIHHVYVVGGFAQANWLEGTRFAGIPALAPETEQDLIERAQSMMPEGMRLLGIDALGIDLLVAGKRQRIALPERSVNDDAVRKALETALNK